MNTLLPDPQPFEWNEKEYRDHIRSVCTQMGVYDGDKQRIEKRNNSTRWPWQIYHRISDPGYHYELYEDLEDAITDYIALNPLPSLE